VTERPARREGLAFLIDWLVLSVVWFVGFVLYAFLAYAVLPEGMSFVTVALGAIGSTLAAIYWLFFSDRESPRSVGRRMLGASQPVSAWDAVRGRAPRA